MKKITVISILITCLFAACNNSPKVEIKAQEVKTSEVKKDSTQMAAVYQCPMDCEKGKTYDKPGICPKCKMELAKK